MTATATTDATNLRMRLIAAAIVSDERRELERHTQNERERQMWQSAARKSATEALSSIDPALLDHVEWHDDTTFTLLGQAWLCIESLSSEMWAVPRCPRCGSVSPRNLSDDPDDYETFSSLLRVATAEDLGRLLRDGPPETNCPACIRDLSRKVASHAPVREGFIFLPDAQQWLAGRHIVDAEYLDNPDTGERDLWVSFVSGPTQRYAGNDSQAIVAWLQGD